MAQQSAHRRGILGVHPAQQRLGLGRIQHAKQVGGVVGVHRLQHVGGPFGVQAQQEFGLIVFGQFLEDVGQSLVVEGVDHLEAAFGRQVPKRVGDRDRTLALELVQ